MTAHTPGPWKRSSDTMIHGGGSACVARVQRGSLSPDESNANARLIAAAPDLLAALKAAQEALNRPMGPQMGPKGKDFGLRERLTDAIAKAEGK